MAARGAAHTLMSARQARVSARVVVLDEDGRVLLCRIVDDRGSQPPVWITPGGGLEPGETLAEAAARELGEETGLAVAPSALGAPVAVSRADWTFRGVDYHSVDNFFVRRARCFEPSDAGLDDEERAVYDGWRWWAPDELDRATERVQPPGLARLARRLHAGERPAEPVELAG